MLKLFKEPSGSALKVSLSGTIEENVDFAKEIGPAPPGTTEMFIVTREISRINSDGVKAWIRYFSEAGKHLSLKLRECSPALVQQINFISNFTCGAVIESILVPFACTKCSGEMLGIYTTEALRQLQAAAGPGSPPEIPGVKCVHCGGPAVFDDIPEEYFLFLTRS